MAGTPGLHAGGTGLTPGTQQSRFSGVPAAPDCSVWGRTASRPAQNTSHLPRSVVPRRPQKTCTKPSKSHGLGYHGDHKAFTASCAQEPPERAPTGGLTCGRSAAARALPGAKHTAASRLASRSDLGTQGRLSQAVLLNTAFSFDHSLFPSRGSGSGSCPSQPHLPHFRNSDRGDPFLTRPPQQAPPWGLRTSGSASSPTWI